MRKIKNTAKPITTQSRVARQKLRRFKLPELPKAQTRYMTMFTTGIARMRIVINQSLTDMGLVSNRVS